MISPSGLINQRVVCTRPPKSLGCFEEHGAGDQPDTVLCVQQPETPKRSFPGGNANWSSGQKAPARKTGPSGSMENAHQDVQSLDHAINVWTPAR